MSKLLYSRINEHGVTVKMYQRGNLFRVYHGTSLYETTNMADAYAVYNN